MQINRRVTNGLAWAGLLIVVGVPSADVITAQFVDGAAHAGDPEANVAMLSGPVVIETDRQQPPADEPTETAEGAANPDADTAGPAAEIEVASADPVESYLESGRELPSYISPGDAASIETASAPVPESAEIATPAPVAKEPNGVADAPSEDVSPSPASEDTVQTATQPAPTGVDNADMAGAETMRTASRQPPMPMPLSMRPEPMEQALVIPERDTNLFVDEAPVPPAKVAGSGGYVTSEELEGWEYGPLSDFLERRDGRSAELVEPGPESGGFFLDELPSDSRAEFRREFVDPGRVVRVYPIY